MHSRTYCGLENVNYVCPFRNKNRDCEVGDLTAAEMSLTFAAEVRGTRICSRVLRPLVPLAANTGRTRNDVATVFLPIAARVRASARVVPLFYKSVFLWNAAQS